MMSMAADPLSTIGERMRLTGLAAAATVGLAALYACERQTTTPSDGTPSLATSQGKGDPAVLALMHKANDRLRARKLGVAIESIEFFTIGQGRPSNRIHAQEFRWVPSDPRRIAQFDDITHLIAKNRATTASGLTERETTGAIQRAFATWSADEALSKVDLIERAYPGGDVTIFDELIDAEKPRTSFDDFDKEDGNPFVADIVNAGWLPRAYFEKVGGPGGGRGILAFSVTFIFQNDDGSPTDINGDNRLDTALNEVYYNNTFGDPSNDRVNNPWRINQPLPAIDVETVALHENGHSLGIGHFGPPPDAVLNPIYAGIRQTPLAPDDAGMTAVWSSWPNP
jgi:hypothetical protein